MTEEKPLQICINKEGKEYLFNILTREELHMQDDIKVAEAELENHPTVWYEERLKVLKSELRNAVYMKIFIGGLPLCKDDIALDIKRKKEG